MCANFVPVHSPEKCWGSFQSEVSEEPMSDGMFEMPYDLVKEDIEKSIRAKWRALKREIRRSRRPRTVNSEGEIFDFQSETHRQEVENVIQS